MVSGGSAVLAMMTVGKFIVRSCGCLPRSSKFVALPQTVVYDVRENLCPTSILYPLAVRDRFADLCRFGLM